MLKPLVLCMPAVGRAVTCALSMAPPFLTPSALRLASFTLTMKPAGSRWWLHV